MPAKLLHTAESLQVIRWLTWDDVTERSCGITNIKEKDPESVILHQDFDEASQESAVHMDKRTPLNDETNDDLNQMGQPGGRMWGMRSTPQLSNNVIPSERAQKWSSVANKINEQDTEHTNTLSTSVSFSLQAIIHTNKHPDSTASRERNIYGNDSTRLRTKLFVPTPEWAKETTKVTLAHATVSPEGQPQVQFAKQPTQLDANFTQPATFHNRNNIPSRARPNTKIKSLLLTFKEQMTPLVHVLTGCFTCMSRARSSNWSTEDMDGGQ